MSLDYYIRRNFDKQAAQKLDASIHALKTVIPNEVISISFGRDFGITGIMQDHVTWRAEVQLSSVADVRLFCENAKLTELKYDGEYFEYGGVSDNVHYFCLIEPENANAMGLKLEDGD